MERKVSLLDMLSGAAAAQLLSDPVISQPSNSPSSLCNSSSISVSEAAAVTKGDLSAGDAPLSMSLLAAAESILSYPAASVQKPAKKPKKDHDQESPLRLAHPKINPYATAPISILGSNAIPKAKSRKPTGESLFGLTAIPKAKSRKPTGESLFPQERSKSPTGTVPDTTGKSPTNSESNISPPPVQIEEESRPAVNEDAVSKSEDPSFHPGALSYATRASSGTVVQRDKSIVCGHYMLGPSTALTVAFLLGLRSVGTSEDPRQRMLSSHSINDEFMSVSNAVHCFHQLKDEVGYKELIVQDMMVSAKDYYAMISPTFYGAPVAPYLMSAEWELRNPEDAYYHYLVDCGIFLMLRIMYNKGNLSSSDLNTSFPDSMVPFAILRKTDLRRSVAIAMGVLILDLFRPCHYTSQEQLLAVYPELSSDKAEYEMLMLLGNANFFHLAATFSSHRSNKGLLLSLIPKLVEGPSVLYVPTKGMNHATADRVLLFERESSIYNNIRRGKVLPQSLSHAGSVEKRKLVILATAGMLPIGFPINDEISGLISEAVKTIGMPKAGDAATTGTSPMNATVNSGAKSPAGARRIKSQLHKEGGLSNLPHFLQQSSIINEIKLDPDRSTSLTHFTKLDAAGMKELLLPSYNKRYHRELGTPHDEEKENCSGSNIDKKQDSAGDSGTGVNEAVSLITFATGDIAKSCNVVKVEGDHRSPMTSFTSTSISIRHSTRGATSPIITEQSPKIYFSLSLLDYLKFTISIGEGKMALLESQRLKLLCFAEMKSKMSVDPPVPLNCFALPSATPLANPNSSTGAPIKDTVAPLLITDHVPCINTHIHNSQQFYSMMLRGSPISQKSERKSIAPPKGSPLALLESAIFGSRTSSGTLSKSSSSVAHRSINATQQVQPAQYPANMDNTNSAGNNNQWMAPQQKPPQQKAIPQPKAPQPKAPQPKKRKSQNKQNLSPSVQSQYGYVPLSLPPGGSFYPPPSTGGMPLDPANALVPPLIPLTTAGTEYQYPCEFSIGSGGGDRSMGSGAAVPNPNPNPNPSLGHVGSQGLTNPTAHSHFHSQMISPIPVIPSIASINNPSLVPSVVVPSSSINTIPAVPAAVPINVASGNMPGHKSVAPSGVTARGAAGDLSGNPSPDKIFVDNQPSLSESNPSRANSNTTLPDKSTSHPFLVNPVVLAGEHKTGANPITLQGLPLYPNFQPDKFDYGGTLSGITGPSQSKR